MQITVGESNIWFVILKILLNSCTEVTENAQHLLTSQLTEGSTVYLTNTSQTRLYQRTCQVLKLEGKLVGVSLRSLYVINITLSSAFIPTQWPYIQQ